MDYATYWLLSGLVISAGALAAWWRTRDAFHPAIVLAPPLLYVYAIWPQLLDRDGALEWLVGAEPLTYVSGLYCLSLLGLYLGLLRMPQPTALARLRAQTHQTVTSAFSLSLTKEVRRRLFLLALVFGALSSLSYWASIQAGGGLAEAYGRAKGGGGHLGSGYFHEAVLLAFPAIILIAITAQAARRVRAVDVLLIVVFALPHLLQGTLGGRRGPLFLILCCLLFAWLLMRARPPRLLTVGIALALIGLSVIVVQSQRQALYIGSGGAFDADRVIAAIAPDTETARLQDNDYVAGVASVLTRRYFEDYHWGGRYFVTIVVRPVPRQLWPTKYEDMAWMYRTVEGGGDWSAHGDALGFQPPRGSAVGFIADVYAEFAWGVVVVAVLFGWGLAVLWRRHRLEGGLWTILFGQAMILSIYIPTQSFSAFYHRFLFMAIITALVWRFVVGKPLPPLRSRGNTSTPAATTPTLATNDPLGWRRARPTAARRPILGTRSVGRSE